VGKNDGYDSDESDESDDREGREYFDCEEGGEGEVVGG
jgi:hypothetical protein